MPVGIVDFLEPVDVHIAERKGPARRHRPLHFTRQRAAVGQPGQRVAFRHAFEPFLLADQVGDQPYHACQQQADERRNAEGQIQEGPISPAALRGHAQRPAHVGQFNGSLDRLVQRFRRTEQDDAFSGIRMDAGQLVIAPLFAETLKPGGVQHAREGEGGACEPPERSVKEHGKPDHHGVAALHEDEGTGQRGLARIPGQPRLPRTVFDGQQIVPDGLLVPLVRVYPGHDPAGGQRDVEDVRVQLHHFGGVGFEILDLPPALPEKPFQHVDAGIGVDDDVLDFCGVAFRNIPGSLPLLFLTGPFMAHKEHRAEEKADQQGSEGVEKTSRSALVPRFPIPLPYQVLHLPLPIC